MQENAYERYYNSFLELAKKVYSDTSITPQEGNELMRPFKEHIYAFETNLKTILKDSVESSEQKAAENKKKQIRMR